MLNPEYRDLAPIDNAENSDEYIEALKWAFQNKKIKNIAITGPYGSGKSSIIETFLRKDEEVHGNKKSIRATSLKISMATFLTDTEHNDNKNHLKSDEVEQGILKQLFYKVEPSRIPQSRYRKLHPINGVKVFACTFAGIIIVLFFARMFASTTCDKVLSVVKETIPQTFLAIIVIVLMLLILSGIFTCLYCKIITKFQLKEIKLPINATVQNCNTDANFVFNRNLDEIMYFFEETSYRTVFFEDLDRWEEPQIFVHLRELNNLLNNDDLIRKKPIVFVYAVRDDIFTTQDRTKFFDFIIPVIPVVSSTNSGEIMLQRLEESNKNGIEHDISKNFVNDISPFISDMRVLQNIYNEFVIYKRTLTKAQGLNLSDEKMFAMIVFKNLYPKDFAEIQGENSIFKFAIKEKNAFIAEKKKDLQGKITILEKQQEETKQDSSKDNDENDIEGVIRDLEMLREKRHLLSGISFVELLKEYSARDIFSATVQNNDFFVFLLRRGYVDENYTNYINYFKGTSIALDDMNFILSVKKQEPLKFSYHLTRTPMVIERLQEFEFEQKAIYNFDILEQLLESEASEKLNIFIKQLADGEEISWQFIDEFFDRTQKQALFVKLLAENWSEFWVHISCDAELTYERQLMYLRIILSEADISTIESLNLDDCMTQYFEEHDDILQRVTTCDPEKIISVIESLDIHFRTLNTQNVSSKILDNVFDKCQYEINEVMIKNVIAYKNDTLLEKFERKPYSTIIKLGSERLLQYAYNNISDYVERIVLAQNSPSDESEDIVDLLIRLEGESELQIKLIEQEEFRLESIKNCACDKISTSSDTWKPVWDALLDNNVIELSWENVQEYWKTYKISETLAKYIESNADNLSTLDTSAVEDNFIKNFISENFGTEVEKKLLPVLRLGEFDLDIQEIQESTLQIMIDCKYFEFTSERYVAVNIVSPKLGIDFIINNQEEYMKIRNEVSMSPSLLENLIFNANFDRRNTELIFSEYADVCMTSEIAMHMKSLNLPVTKEIFDAAWDCLDGEERKELLLDYCKILEADKLESYFAKLDKPYSELSNRSRRHNVSLRLTEKHKMLSEHLKKIGYITSFEEKKDVLKLRVKQVK